MQWKSCNFPTAIMTSKVSRRGLLGPRQGSLTLFFRKETQALISITANCFFYLDSINADTSLKLFPRELWGQGKPGALLFPNEHGALVPESRCTSPTCQSLGAEFSPPALRPGPLSADQALAEAPHEAVVHQGRNPGHRAAGRAAGPRLRAAAWTQGRRLVVLAARRRGRGAGTGGQRLQVRVTVAVVRLVLGPAAAAPRLRRQLVGGRSGTSRHRRVPAVRRRRRRCRACRRYR